MSIHNSEKVAFEAKTNSSEEESQTQGEVVTEEHGHLSIGDVLRGTAVQELTPFERKAALINVYVFEDASCCRYFG
jgi:hypothetical protein